MAVSWDVTVTVTNLVERRVHITAVRVDDVAQTTWNHSLDTIVPEGATEVQAANKLVADVWAAWQATQTKEAQIAAFLGSIESLAESGLDAQEGS